MEGLPIAVRFPGVARERARRTDTTAYALRRALTILNWQRGIEARLLSRRLRPANSGVATACFRQIDIRQADLGGQQRTYESCGSEVLGVKVRIREKSGFCPFRVFSLPYRVRPSNEGVIKRVSFDAFNLARAFRPIHTRETPGRNPIARRRHLLQRCLRFFMRRTRP